METGIHVGNKSGDIKEAMPEITDSILKILATSAGDDVKIKALDILKSTFAVEGTMISNCSLSDYSDKDK